MIFSFYSYKGGVGRTQLVANLAAYLCYYEAKKILLIDWDLEAPGLDMYFEGIFENKWHVMAFMRRNYPTIYEEYIEKRKEAGHAKTIYEHEWAKSSIDNVLIRKAKEILEQRKSEKGLIDFLNDYITLAKTTGNQAKIAANIPNYKEYIFQAIPEMEGTGKVDILSAGKFDEHYIQKVNDFDWEGFKERYNGIGFIEEYWKPQLQNGDYDYIFIDSRTGISDYAGICNILMPDANVILVAPNKQNMQGAKRIAEGIVSSGYVQKGKRKPLILPLLARVDTSVESSAPKLRSYKELFAETFFPLIFPNKEFTEKAKNDYLKWNETYILEYKRDLSVGENILFDLNKQTIEVSSLANIYKEIATLIQRTDHNSDNFIS